MATKATKKSSSSLATKKKPAAPVNKKSGGTLTRKPAAVLAKKSSAPVSAKKLPPTASSKKPSPPVVAAKAVAAPAPIAAPAVRKPVAPVAAPRSIYSVHPAVTMMQNWVASLKQKTGRTLDEWIALAKKSGPGDIKDRRVWLKEKHGLGTNAAWWIAERAGPEGEAGVADDNPQAYLRAATKYVEDMYAGSKVALRPLHDRLLEIARNMGKDVRVCPCKTIIPIYRRHIFAEIAPVSRTRIDFGLALRDTPASGRLIDTGGWEKKDRITHRIPITSLTDIDSEVERWLRFAYELDS